MKLKDGFILRAVAGETVVIPSSDDMDLDMMITLNDTGRFLWEQLQEEKTLEQLVQATTAEYDVAAEDAAKYIEEFVKKLSENGFLA